MDLYKVLNIDKKASYSDIEKAYKHIIRKYHPALNLGDKLAEEKYKQATLAFKILSNPETKKKYDNNENLKLENFFSEAEFQIKNEFDENLKGKEDNFIDSESSFNTFNDINYYLNVDFIEAFWGTQKEIQLEIPKKCLCRISRNNTNKVGKDNCKVCQGKGFFKSAEKIKIYVPAGVDNGYLIKVRMNNENNWLCNVNIFIKYIPDNFFERKGKNIYIEIPITIIEAILGGIIEIPTPEGIYEMRIPEGTDTDSIFKIVGKGFPQLKKNTRGDLYVKVKINVPKNVDEQGKNLLLKFSKMFPYDPREKIRNKFYIKTPT